MSKAAELAALIANVNKGSSLAAKNFIINGAQNVAQRGTSSTGLGGSTGYYVTDRNKLVFSTSGRLTMEQVADGPSGFLNATKLSCTTADTSIGAGENFLFSQYFEGQNLQSLKKGTSDAVPITVSFYVKGNASATYGMEIYDLDNTRSISTTFDVTTGWTRVEKTFAGDTSGALDDDNAASLAIFLWLHAGSDSNSGTLNTSWNSVTAANRTDSNNTSFFDSTSRTFFITGWQMEIGEKATEFEHEPYSVTLQKAQRYYIRRNAAGAYHYFGAGHVAAVDAGRIYTSFPVEMNHIPVLETSGTASDYACYNSDVDACTSVPALTNASTFETGIQLANSSNAFTLRSGCNLMANNTTDAFLAFESEL